MRRFGRRLYDAFFRSYTEKVWGIPGSEIQSEWAAQRIQEFSLWQAVLGVLHLRRQHVTTLIEEFLYPRLGPGQMWESFSDWVQDHDIPVHLNHRCVGIRHDSGRVESVVVRADGEEREHDVDAVMSSIALRDLIDSLDPPAPIEVQMAAERLGTATCPGRADDHRGRAVPGQLDLPPRPEDAGRAGSELRGLEPGHGARGHHLPRGRIFCNDEDDIWTMSDEDAVKLAIKDLSSIGILDPEQVFNGVKVRVPKAYPMYDASYDASRLPRSAAIWSTSRTCRTFGRNGLHRYNNQDHSMWTAILATLNHTDGASHDVWSVNTRAEYLEEGPLAERLGDVDLVS